MKRGINRTRCSLKATDAKNVLSCNSDTIILSLLLLSRKQINYFHYFTGCGKCDLIHLTEMCLASVSGKLTLSKLYLFRSLMMEDLSPFVTN